MRHDAWDLGALLIPEAQVELIHPRYIFADFNDIDFSTTPQPDQVLVFMGYPTEINDLGDPIQLLPLPCGPLSMSQYKRFNVNPMTEIGAYYNVSTTYDIERDVYRGPDPSGMSGGAVLIGNLSEGNLSDINFKIKGIGANYSLDASLIVALNFSNRSILDGLDGA